MRLDWKCYNPGWESPDGSAAIWHGGTLFVLYHPDNGPAHYQAVWLPRELRVELEPCSGREYLVDDEPMGQMDFGLPGQWYSEAAAKLDIQVAVDEDILIHEIADSPAPSGEKENPTP
jgi:hypothetical protein